MQSFIELAIIIVSIIIFAKLAGVFRKISLGAGAKKFLIIGMVVVLVGLNVVKGIWADMQLVFIGVGLLAVILFALGLMSESSDAA